MGPCFAFGPCHTPPLSHICGVCKEACACYRCIILQVYVRKPKIPAYQVFKYVTDQKWQLIKEDKAAYKKYKLRADEYEAIREANPGFTHLQVLEQMTTWDGEEHVRTSIIEVGKVPAYVYVRVLHGGNQLKLRRACKSRQCFCRTGFRSHTCVMSRCGRLRVCIIVHVS